MECLYGHLIKCKSDKQAIRTVIVSFSSVREIHPLDPQPLRYCMLASTASVPRVKRCSLGLYWSRDLCSKHALAGWGMSSYLGQIVRGCRI